MTLEHYPLMLAEPAAPTQSLEVAAPFDRSTIARVDLAGEQAIDRALDTAANLWGDQDQWLPTPTRLTILEKAASIMRSRRDMLAREAAREGGKPLVDSQVEVDRGIEGVLCAAETLRQQHGVEIPMNRTASSAGRYATTFHQPIGPVLAFSAFNHPLNLIVHQVAPAVAAGCPILVKPAEATPLSCFRFVEILREAGLPPAWAQTCLTENIELAGKMVADSRIKFFSFIGSSRVGWMLRSKLAPGVRCALEHGGAAPVIVAEDADVDAAIPLLTKGGFYHAGQVCVSVQRVYVHQSRAQEVAEKLATAASALRVGDPTDSETDVGPLIRPQEVQRVADWVDQARPRSQVLCGGQAISETCYRPTVLVDPPVQASVTTEEIFGPVVCVYAYQELDAALQAANALPFAFQAAVFTNNLDVALRASRRLHAAAVMVNDHTAFRVDWMPFAGLQQSGLGIGGIPYTLKDMQIEKMVVIQSPQLLS